VVTGGRARGVRLEGEGRLASDAVLFNGDAAALAGGLLGRDAASSVKAPSPGLASLSAITWAIAGRAEGFPLEHHNVFFSADYPREFQALLREGRCADEPTVYACAQGPAQQGAVGTNSPDEERLLLVVNAPPTGADAAAWTDEEIHRWERATFSTLTRCGLTLTPRATRVTTPADFHRRFPGTGGSLYGQRARGALSPLSRPGSRSKTQGLYLAGGSIHPGPGVPMAALSGRLAAQQILADLGSTPRSPRGGTSGTTPTR
jgi:1-hydroxycarotenoid 3,4-desaturase